MFFKLFLLKIHRVICISVSLSDADSKQRLTINVMGIALQLNASCAKRNLSIDRIKIPCAYPEAFCQAVMFSCLAHAAAAAAAAAADQLAFIPTCIHACIVCTRGGNTPRHCDCGREVPDLFSLSLSLSLFLDWEPLSFHERCSNGRGE